MTKSTVILSILFFVCSLSGCTTQKMINKITNDDHHQNEVTIGIQMLNNKHFTDAIEHFHHLANKHGQDKDVFFYLAYAYDSHYKHLKKIGKEHNKELEASIDYYKIFLKCNPEKYKEVASLYLKNMSDEYIKLQVEKARDSFDSGRYKDTMDFIREELYNGKILYDLEEYIDTSNMFAVIEELYDRCVARYFSREVKLWYVNSGIKTVAVFDFMAMENVQDDKGKVLSSVLESEIDGFQEIRRTLRDHQLMQIILKEYALFETGILDNDSKKNLAMKGIDGIVTGKISNDKTFLKLFNISGEIPKTAYVYNLYKRPSSPGWTRVEEIKNPNPDFQVEVWTDKNAYKIGEKAQIYFRATKDCYLELWNEHTNGERIQIFPNYYHSNNFITAGKVFSIPPENRSYSIKVTPPAGIDGIKAIARIKKDEIDDSFTTFSNVEFRNISDDEVRERGLEIVGSKTTESSCTFKILPY